ncbi:MAG TPA: hypothetical protein VHK01_14495 [Lacipirellulaceae bacterium]|nr:hypothetical protein [Lacipirellulaceae bacterium]
MYRLIYPGLRPGLSHRGLTGLFGICRSHLPISCGNIARLELQKNATLRTLERYAEEIDCFLEVSVVSRT